MHGAAPDPAAYELAYKEGQRALEEQERVVVELRSRAGQLIAAAAILVLLLAGAGYFWRSRTSAKLTDKDPIVIADFTNTTNDPVFDNALKSALAIQLEQSPYLNILSDAQIAKTMSLMGHPPTEKLTDDMARQVCVRASSSIAASKFGPTASWASCIASVIGVVPARIQA